MNKRTLNEAIRVAQQFIAVARTVRQEPKSDWLERSKESGAVKRASMELTRALSEMRRSS